MRSSSMWVASSWRAGPTRHDVHGPSLPSVLGSGYCPIMTSRSRAMLAGVVTLAVGTFGFSPQPAAAAPAPEETVGVTRIVLTDEAGQRSPAAVAGAPDNSSLSVDTGEITVDEFLVAGLTWAPDDQLAADVRMRVREQGNWSDWLEIAPDDASDGAAARAGSEPFVTGGADGVQIEVACSPADLPADLHLTMISSAQKVAPAMTSRVMVASDSMAAVAAVSASNAPAIHTRAAWGLTAAEEQYTSNTWPPEFAQLKAAVVHHTAGTNNYTAAQSAGVVHAIWQYHAQVLAWGDIGYNFLVDKYGQMFEGRRNSMPASGGYSIPSSIPAGFIAQGGHASSYNKGTLGISAMGDYSQTALIADPTLVVEPIAQLIAWKFEMAGLDVVDASGKRVPSGIVSPGTSAAYPVGTQLPRIIGHKDVNSTLCPGSIGTTAVMNAVYDRVLQLSGQVTPPPAGTSFADVPLGLQFQPEIEWMFAKGVSRGWEQPDGTRLYKPFEPVLRDAMAAFMYQLAGSPAYTPPNVSPFTDVTTSTQFYKEIAWLAESGISTGWPDGTFRPWASVNRDAMAAFMYRFAGKPAYAAPDVSPFADVTPATQFYPEMAWLAEQGISTGWPDKTFRPVTPVYRDAMAAFMRRLNSAHGSL